MLHLLLQNAELSREQGAASRDVGSLLDPHHGPSSHDNHYKACKWYRLVSSSFSKDSDSLPQRLSRQGIGFLRIVFIKGCFFFCFFLFDFFLLFVLFCLLFSILFSFGVLKISSSIPFLMFCFDSLGFSMMR